MVTAHEERLQKTLAFALEQTSDPDFQSGLSGLDALGRGRQIERLFEILTNREMGTVLEGIGGEYPQYDGPFTYSLETRRLAAKALGRLIEFEFKLLFHECMTANLTGLEGEMKELAECLSKAGRAFKVQALSQVKEGDTA